MADNPTYVKFNELLETMKTSMREHGGTSDLLPDDEFDCCAADALKSIWPEILALQTRNTAMWNTMQRACNHPERWNEILSEALDAERTS